MTKLKQLHPFGFSYTSSGLSSFRGSCRPLLNLLCYWRHLVIYFSHYIKLYNEGITTLAAKRIKLLMNKLHFTRITPSSGDKAVSLSVTHNLHSFCWQCKNVYYDILINTTYDTFGTLITQGFATANRYTFDMQPSPFIHSTKIFNLFSSIITN